MCDQCKINQQTVRKITSDRVRILFKNSSVITGQVLEGLSVVGKVRMDLSKIKFKRDKKIADNYDIINSAG